MFSIFALRSRILKSSYLLKQLVRKSLEYIYGVGGIITKTLTTVYLLGKAFLETLVEIVRDIPRTMLVTLKPLELLKRMPRTVLNKFRTEFEVVKVKVERYLKKLVSKRKM
jgi:hypothetical protein